MGPKPSLIVMADNETLFEILANPYVQISCTERTFEFRVGGVI